MGKDRVVNLADNEMTVLPNEFKNSECHLSQLPTNHCSNANKTLKLHHSCRSLLRNKFPDSLLVCFKRQTTRKLLAS